MTDTNIYHYLKNLITESLQDDTGADSYTLDNITIETPKEDSFGDLSTNAAMIIAAQTKSNPRNIAEKIIARLANNEIFESVTAAGPGFINFRFRQNFWAKTLESIISSSSYGKNNSGKGQRVNIEFVSANPTGPMHIGHARGAIYGDVLARIMSYSGYDVTKEYYVNDAGSQIQTLVTSAHLRYKEALGETIHIGEGLYPGEYLKDLAENIRSEFGDKFQNLDVHYQDFRNLVVSKLLDVIKNDLKDLKIEHDIFFSETSLYEKHNASSYIEDSFTKLQKAGLIYKGQLPAPKGEEDPDWEDREQLLFRSSEFGDDQDRSLTKSDGSYTYFAGDIAYAKSKIDRGFTKNFIVLGADHIGYVRRLQSVYTALSQGKARAHVILCQMVNFIQERKPVKMSKRAGNFTTVSDVIREVGTDILRFTMLTRKNDMILDFDLDLVKSQSKENPIFYVQYAQVRGLSVINNAKQNALATYEKFSSNNIDLSKINSRFELALIRDLSLFPRLIENIANSGEVHKLCYYLQSLAASFHAFWNMGKENAEYKFITEDATLSAARLALVNSVIKILREGLIILGVTPLDKM